MDRKVWASIVEEARDRFSRDVDEIIEADGSNDVAIRSLQLVRELVRLFADQLALVGLERLP